MRERWELYRNGRPRQSFATQSQALAAQSAGQRRFRVTPSGLRTLCRAGREQ